MIHFGVLTVSDRSARGERTDASGPVLEQAILEQGWSVARLREALANWADSGEVDIILTTGGTGFSRRDVTPEATKAVIEREAPGLAEAMRLASLKVTPHAMLSRATAGIRGRTLIVNLPGSPKAALENLQVVMSVLPHAVQLLTEDPQGEAGHSLSEPGMQV